MKSDIQTYIDKLRPSHPGGKQWYAKRYLDYREGAQTNPPHHDNTLSYEAAQMVRMNINILFDCPGVRLAK